MRLLFDQNLAASLVQRLADVYPGSQHVRDVGLGSADDGAVWAYAAERGQTIVSKDAEFSPAQLSQGSAAEGRVDSPRQLFHGRSLADEQPEVREAAD